MSGSSKSKNIKHRKNAQDAKRSKEFSRLGKAIRIAVVEAGDDPDKNPQLRTAIQDAKKANMPKENIQRAIQSAIGSDEANNELQFACYAGGVAILIDCATDNTNRTVSHVRAQLRRHNAEIAKPGALQHIFSEQMHFLLPKTLEEDKVLDLLITFDLEEPEQQQEAWLLRCDAAIFAEVKVYLAKEKIELLDATRQRSAQFPHPVSQHEFQKLKGWLDTMQAHEDIVAIYHNAQPTP